MKEFNSNQLCGLAKEKRLKGERGSLRIRAGFLFVATAFMVGCINVTAPEEPIVIELNINITATVLLALAEDAESTIDENADIF